MTHFLQNFRRDQDGAVTVDWVVLTAAIVALSVTVMATISRSALDESTGLGAYIGSISVSTF